MRLPALKRLRLPRAGWINAKWIGAGILATTSFWAGHSFDRWTGAGPPAIQTGSQPHDMAAANKAAQKPASKAAPKPAKAALAPGTVFVRRGKSVLRDGAKWSAHTIARKEKGAMVTLLELPGDGWAKVKDGDTVGWMRASVLGDNPATDTR